MKRNTRKGFTGIELVIVIAIIAILAASLIPSFGGLINGANKTADTQLVKNLNMALLSDLDGADTMSEALALAAEYGYDVAKINAKATGNEILWDAKNNVFCYLNGDTVEYIPENPAGETASGADFWVISNNIHPTYSTYLYGYTGTGVEIVTKGLDVGNCTLTDITYAGTGTAIIRTNGGNLTVHSGSVNHYGYANFLSVADGATYSENGKVVANLADVDTLTEEEKSEYTVVYTADGLKEALANKVAKIALGADITINDEISAANANVFSVTSDTEINLNGFNITATRNAAPNVSVNNVLINVSNDAHLTLSGYGVLSVTHTGSNMGWNSLSSVLRCGNDGNITVNDAVVVEHRGGTDMSYGIDIYASSGNNVVTINGGAITSTYISIRMFYPKANDLGRVYINKGILSAGSREIWIQGAENEDCVDFVVVGSDYEYTYKTSGTSTNFYFN